jgi:hypothetical protein
MERKTHPVAKEKMIAYNRSHPSRSPAHEMRAGIAG